MEGEALVREQHAKTAIVERLFTHTVGITNRALAATGRDPVTGSLVREHECPGTGLAARWGDNHFVLTAKHVLDEANPTDLSFFARPVSSLKHVAEASMEDAIVATPVSGGQCVVRRCDFEDLALVTMPNNALGPLVEFADIRLWVDPCEGDLVTILGYPVSAGVIFQRQTGPGIQRAVLLAPVAFSTEVLPSATGRFFSEFDSIRHYLVQYDLAAGGKHPRGISGAASWIQSTEPHSVWAPRYNFAGICTSAYRNGSIEKVVKASTVREFLIELFGTTVV